MHFFFNSQEMSAETNMQNLGWKQDWKNTDYSDEMSFINETIQLNAFPSFNSYHKHGINPILYVK